MATRASLTALGQPSIPTPRSVDLPALQQSINNIRERIQLVEAFAKSTRGLLGSTQTKDTLDFLQQQINSVKNQVDVLAAQIRSLGEDEPDDGRLSWLSAVVAELVKEAQDNRPPDPLHAVVTELVKRVDALEPGVL